VLEEPPRGHRISFGRDLDVDDLTELVDRAVDAMPTASNLDVWPVEKRLRTCEVNGYRVRRIGLGSAVGPGPRGGAMPTIIGHHDVKDRDHWLASPKREEFFGPLGVTNIRTFIDPQNATRVAVLMDVADMDALMAGMQSEGAAEAMAHDGVLPETLVILVEA
jgi:hypothetical protein